MANRLMVCTIDSHNLAAIVGNRNDNILILDGRSFLEYNVSHIFNAVNVGCAKLMKRRLQQEKLSIEEFLAQNCHWNVDRDIDIIVYDQNTCDPRCLPLDSFMGVFLHKLLPVYNSVSLLKGGFLEFQATYPHLCQNEKAKCVPLTSLSQPCLSITNHGPTRILSFLYLGSQNDALNQEVLQHYNITYQLNVSNNCPMPVFIQESHFMRIPVIDNYSEKLLPHFQKAFQFLDKVKESGGSVLIHCLAGISRSATVAIAYVMKTLKMTSDEAYRYVKSKRATVSPNFNFLGQLLEFEKQLQLESVLDLKSESSTTPLFNSSSPYKQSSGNSFYNSTENTNLCFSPKQTSSSFCIKYADEAETGSHQFNNIGQCFVSFKKKENTSRSPQNHIPNKQSSATFNIKCIPTSSLRELNFMPCQTSSFKSTLTLREDKIHTKDNLKFKNCSSMAMSGLVSPTSPKRSETRQYSSVLELQLPDKYGNARGMTTISPDSISPGDFKAFEFDSKSYNRSDSVSTSGLGSEGSDCTDSWNDFTSSCERETDVSMDDDYSSVPSSDGVFHRSKNSSNRNEFEDSFEDPVSFYPNYEPYRIQHDVNNELVQTVPSMNAKLQLSKYEKTLKWPLMNENHNISESIDFCKTQLLYRAQSCPGMLSTEVSSSESECSERNGLSGSVKLRKAKSKFSQDKFRNRYSCSSIDYMEYSLSANLSHESCPDVLQLDSRSKNSNISSSQYDTSFLNHSNYSSFCYTKNFFVVSN